MPISSLAIVDVCDSYQDELQAQTIERGRKKTTLSRDEVKLFGVGQMEKKHRREFKANPKHELKLTHRTFLHRS
jgi:hypothetical protein